MQVFIPLGSDKRGTIPALRLIFWAAAIGISAADEPPGPCDCCSTVAGNQGSMFWCGVEPLPRDPWYVSVDGVAMQRLFSGLGEAASLGTNPGRDRRPEPTEPRQPVPGWRPDALGTYLHGYALPGRGNVFMADPLAESAQAASSADNLFSPFSNFGSPTVNPIVDNNSFVQIGLVSRLQTEDLCLKSKLPLPEGDPTVILLVGVRQVGVREEFDYFSTPSTNVNPVAVHAHTNNNIWGPEIGGLASYAHQNVWLTAQGKTAICNNDFDSQLLADINGASASHPRAANSTTTMYADIKVMIEWRPTSAITAQIGYQAMWIDQLALAARNFSYDVPTLTDAAAEPPINSRGTLIYSGPFAGLQLNW